MDRNRQLGKNAAQETYLRLQPFELTYIRIGTLVNGGQRGLFKQEIGNGFLPGFASRCQRLKDQDVPIAIDDQAGEIISIQRRSGDTSCVTPQARILTRLDGRRDSFAEEFLVNRFPPQKSRHGL